MSVLTQVELDGERLSELELDLFFMLLAVAGNETTRNLMSGAMVAFSQFPDQWERLRARPDPSCPRRSRRCCASSRPVMNFRRQATEDVEIGGETIKEGDKVVFFHVSANRDETVFEDPDRFDVGRKPNPHMAFGGGGPHFCLGANLARMEIVVMFEHLLDRLPDIHVDGPVQRLQSNFINGVKHLPVAFSPSAADRGPLSATLRAGRAQGAHPRLPPGPDHRRGPAAVRRARHDRSPYGRDRHRGWGGPVDVCTCTSPTVTSCSGPVCNGCTPCCSTPWWLRGSVTALPSSDSAPSWSACSSASTTTPPSSGWPSPRRASPARSPRPWAPSSHSSGSTSPASSTTSSSRARSSGDFRLLDPDKAMTFVGQQLYGAMSVRAGDPSPAPLEEAADELCTFLLYGLAGPALGAHRTCRWLTGLSLPGRARSAGSTGRRGGHAQWSPCVVAVPARVGPRGRIAPVAEVAWT